MSCAMMLWSVSRRGGQVAVAVRVEIEIALVFGADSD